MRKNNKHINDSYLKKICVGSPLVRTGHLKVKGSSSYNTASDDFDAHNAIELGIYSLTVPVTVVGKLLSVVVEDTKLDNVLSFPCAL